MRYQEFTGLAQALFEESGEALFLLDAMAEHVLDANAAVQRLCGLSLRELLASAVSDLFLCDDRRGLRPLPAHTRSAHGPLALGRCQLRTIQPTIWMPVDISMTRLLVRPQQLVLLSVRNNQPEAGPARYLDVESERRLCVNCGATVGYLETEGPRVPAEMERLAIRASSLVGQELHN